MKTQILYRFWSGDALLYVGVSANAYRRAGEHRRGAAWFEEADRVTFERFPDRKSVLVAEQAAIRAERPKYNVQFAAAQSPRLEIVFDEAFMHRVMTEDLEVAA